MTGDRPGLIRIVIHKPTGNLVTIQPHAGHHLAPPELTNHTPDSHRKKAATALAKHLYGTLIQRQLTPGLQMAGQPLFARCNTPLLGKQQSSYNLTLPQPGKYTVNTPTDNNRERSGACRQSRCAKFRDRKSTRLNSSHVRI